MCVHNIMIGNWPSGPGRDSLWRGRWSCRLESLQWCCLLTQLCSPHPASVGVAQHQDTFSHSHNDAGWKVIRAKCWCFVQTHTRSISEQHLGLSSCLSPTHLLSHCFLDCFGLLFGSGWDGSLQFPLCSPLLGQQLWVDVGQDSARCNGHTF